MNKRGIYFLIVLAILTLILPSIYGATTGFVSPINPGHNGTQVFVPIGSGKYITLQDSIDNGYLLGRNTSSITIIPLPVFTPYHVASQILINVTSGNAVYTMTLQEAIDHGVLSGAPSVNYTKIVPAGGEYAYNINVNTTSNIKTLQYAVANSLLSSIPATLLCPTGYTCPNGLATGSACYPTSGGSLGCAGTINSNRGCSNFLMGYTCGGSQQKGCNGAGYCVGYSGSGCGSCPFGTKSSNAAGDTLCINHAGGLWYRSTSAGSSQASGVSYCVDSVAPTCRTCDWLGKCNDVSWLLYPCAFG